LVRRFAERSQFIVVTHQKRTMDAADILYGISMGGDGVTKVVSRKLPREHEPGAAMGEPEGEAAEAA
jgi:chromosome segregation protein